MVRGFFFNRCDAPAADGVVSSLFFFQLLSLVVETALLTAPMKRLIGSFSDVHLSKVVSHYGEDRRLWHGSG
jgi:hypothetical protein